MLIGNWKCKNPFLSGVVVDADGTEVADCNYLWTNDEPPWPMVCSTYEQGFDKAWLEENSHSQSKDIRSCGNLIASYDIIASYYILLS